MAKRSYTAGFRRDFIQAWSRFTGIFLEHCIRWGVSRQTGYDWVTRWEAHGDEGMETRSSAPHQCPHAVADDIVQHVLAARKLHPTWGPRKLRPWLLAQTPSLTLPAPSTMGEILKRAGMVPTRRRRQRVPRYSEPFSTVQAPNDVWTVDFKGQFHTRDGKPCYPLTIADAHSRFLIRCDAYLAPDASCKDSFVSAFEEYGLPLAIRSDNGTPFVGSRSPAGLSTLSVWFVRLGIVHERIALGSPWENGRHERMHRTLKEEATEPPQANRNVQQRQFNRFRHEFNHERPHESLGQRPPATAYNSSARSYPKRLLELEYPDDFELRSVSASGHIGWRGKHIWLSSTLGGQLVGLKPISDDAYEVYFGPILLGTLYDRCLHVGLVKVGS